MFISSTDKLVDVYERLADAMEAQPAGFTRTPSRLEIKLLKLVFTPEEALVAGTLSRKPETAADIAGRVGLPEAEVIVLLESMIPRRMVRADTLALETGVKGLGKVEAKPGQRPRPRASRDTVRPLSGWLVRILPSGKQVDPKGICRDLRQYVMRAGVRRFFHRGPVRRASSHIAARSNPSGSNGSPTMTSMLTSRDMSVSW